MKISNYSKFATLLMVFSSPAFAEELCQNPDSSLGSCVSTRKAVAITGAGVAINVLARRSEEAHLQKHFPREFQALLEATEALNDAPAGTADKLRAMRNKITVQAELDKAIQGKQLVAGKGKIVAEFYPHDFAVKTNRAARWGGLGMTAYGLSYAIDAYRQKPAVIDSRHFQRIKRDQATAGHNEQMDVETYMESVPSN